MGKEGLNDDVTIVLVGGADKIATFICQWEKRIIYCVLAGYIYGSKEARLKRMVEQKIIADKKIIFYHTVIEQTLRYWGSV